MVFIKGNPVKIRNSTRYCNSRFAYAKYGFYTTSHCPPQGDGKAVKTEKSQETCQMKTINILLPGNEVYVELGARVLHLFFLIASEKKGLECKVFFYNKKNN